MFPKFIDEWIEIKNSVADWKKREFLDNSPQFIKQKVLLRHGINDAPWIETGTYKGTTTSFLSDFFPHVYSIEPEPSLYKSACENFKGKNVTLFNDVSESILPSLLPQMKGSINFWLDGHYSSGITFKGDKDCPVEEELNAIKENIDNFKNVCILIDDDRCFLDDRPEFSDYPSIDYLVDWSRNLSLSWQIVHDIFIIKSKIT